MSKLEITEHYTMPDGATATIRAYRSPKGVYGAKLELVNGNTLPISIGGTPGKPVRSLVGAMSGAKKFLRGVYGSGGSAGWGTSHLSHVSAPQGFAGFSTWADVIDAAKHGETLFYKPPMNLRPSSIMVKKIYKNGGLRIDPLSNQADDFTADSGHLDRFFRRV